MVQSHQEVNQEIIDALQYLVETYPDLRFSQILSTWGFVDDWQNEYYIEPNIILKRVKQRMENI